MRNHPWIGEGIFIHLFAPATPVGININQNHFGIFGIGSNGLLKLHPLDRLLTMNSVGQGEG